MIQLDRVVSFESVSILFKRGYFINLNLEMFGLVYLVYVIVTTSEQQPVSYSFTTGCCKLVDNVKMYVCLSA